MLPRHGGRHRQDGNAGCARLPLRLLELVRDRQHARFRSVGNRPRRPFCQRGQTTCFFPSGTIQAAFNSPLSRRNLPPSHSERRLSLGSWRCCSAFCSAWAASCRQRPRSSPAEPVDVELVLAVDISRSMDSEEFALQRAGYVAALRHPDFVNAVRAGLHGRIALTYFEWAGTVREETQVPWQVIDSAETADAFAGMLEDRPVRSFRGTSISSALTYGAEPVRRQCLRRLPQGHRRFRRRPEQYRPAGGRRARRGRNGRHHGQRAADPDPAVVHRARSRPLLRRMRDRRTWLLRAADQTSLGIRDRHPAQADPGGQRRP